MIVKGKSENRNQGGQERSCPKFKKKYPGKNEYLYYRKKGHWKNSCSKLTENKEKHDSTTKNAYGGENSEIAVMVVHLLIVIRMSGFWTLAAPTISILSKNSFLV